MALLPRVPHYYDNAIAEAYLEYTLKGRDPHFILQSARMVDCLRSFCRSCTPEQFNALALVPGATSHPPPKNGARKRRLTRPALQPVLRPSAKAKPRLPLISPLACASWPGSQQQSYPYVREQSSYGASQRPSELLPGSQHWESRPPHQEHSISLDASLTLSVPSGEESRIRHPRSPSFYFQGRADASIIVKQLKNSFQPADKIIRAPLFEEIWGMNTLSKPDRACVDEHPSVKSRLRRLFATYQEIGRIKQHYALGLRILILMMRHEKEVLMSEFTGSLRKGQRLDSYANEQIAQVWNIDELKVNYKFVQAKRYLALIRRGPGCLLYVKSSTWETRLKDEQVDSLCEYFERVRGYLALEGLETSDKPSTAKAALERQNFCIAKLIIQSLLHFGWTHGKLAKSGTNLVKALGNYVDLLALEQGRICDKSGRYFQGDHECEVDGEDNGSRGDDGGQGEGLERNDETDSAVQIPGVQENLPRVSKRRRIDSDQPSCQQHGALDQQRTTSPQSHNTSASLQRTSQDGQASQCKQDTGKPSIQSTERSSNVQQDPDNALHPGSAENLGLNHGSMYLLDTMPNIDFAGAGYTDWEDMRSWDLERADYYYWDDMRSWDLERADYTY